MRRLAACLFCLLPLGQMAQAAHPPAAAAATAPSGPPHGWLFGVWTGGLYPPPTKPGAQICLGQPSVIFTRDVVLRATLTEVAYVQRLVETARTSANHTDFRLVPEAPPATGGTSPLGLVLDQPNHGFGCEDADTLHVRRLNATTITFPGCSDFPYPLVRCPTR
jgi:hypothetical protein